MLTKIAQYLLITMLTILAMVILPYLSQINNTFYIQDKSNYTTAYLNNTVFSNNNFSALPYSEIILRQGNKIFYPPVPKYTNKNYLDINIENGIMTLFFNGNAQAMYKVAAYGNPNTPYTFESSPTPKGEFKVLNKEENHFSSISKVWMPWSIHIFDNIFIHGIPYYPDGTLIKSKYSNGCIRVATIDQKKLWQQIPVGTTVVVY